jgi:YD repeat-containing protein
MIDGSGTTSYTYNPFTGTPTLGVGRLASVAGPISSSAISYSYDALGRVLTSSVNGSANATALTYDALGRVSLVTNPLGTFTPSYVNQTGRLSSLVYPNSQRTNISYYSNSSGGTTGNGDDRPETISNLSPSGTNLSTFGYTYASNGEIQT